MSKMLTVAALRTTLSWLTLPAPSSFVHILRSCKLTATTASQQCWRATQGWSSIFHSTHARRQYITQAGQRDQLRTKCFSNCFWCRLRGKQQQAIAGIRMIGSNSRPRESQYKRTVIIYVCAAGIFMLGMSYAGVPLYRMFCQATGLGGTVQKGHDTSKISEMQKVEDRVIRVRFNADVASSMRWNFKPQQTEVKVFPGETALAFYTAKNPTDKPIIGISTYNVVPFEAGQYFNKIQCFCFEEQRLNPHEQVDMPVFFYIDPEFAEDPKLKNVDTITLSYTFFEAKEGLSLPLPGYMAQ